jgi:hypothetical protein
MRQPLTCATRWHLKSRKKTAQAHIFFHKLNTTKTLPVDQIYFGIAPLSRPCPGCGNLPWRKASSYVYVGNAPLHRGNNTYCHQCKKLLIDRQGYFITAYNLEANQCKFCQTVIPGVWGDSMDGRV